MTATVIGLGEAGALYARGLAQAGFDVHGYDPYTTLVEPSITQHDDLAAALGSADLVITLVGARAARAVTEEVLGELASIDHAPLLADFNTGSPALKRELSKLAAAQSVLFADVAVLAPVPRDGARTPLMVSGSGADRLAELFSTVGGDVEVIGGVAGDAATRKLIRSSFMKGLAGVVLESVGAGEAAGCGEWVREQIVAELGGSSASLIDRLIVGSRLHAERRAHEVEDASAFLQSIGQPSWSTDAAGTWLRHLRDMTPSNSLGTA